MEKCPSCNQEVKKLLDIKCAFICYECNELRKRVLNNTMQEYTEDILIVRYESIKGARNNISRDYYECEYKLPQAFVNHVIEKKLAPSHYIYYQHDIDLNIQGNKYVCNITVK